jgi:hypothetical protein
MMLASVLSELKLSSVGRAKLLLFYPVDLIYNLYISVITSNVCGYHKRTIYIQTEIIAGKVSKRYNLEAHGFSSYCINIVP